MWSKQAASFAVLIAFLILAYGSSDSRNSGTTPGSSSPSTTSGNVSRERWDTIAATLKEQGAPYMSVEPYDSTAPNTMRIILSGRIARDMSAYDARRLAATTRSRLGDSAIVYVKDDTGKRLAKAAPWGTE